MYCSNDDCVNKINHERDAGGRDGVYQYIPTTTQDVDPVAIECMHKK